MVCKVTLAAGPPRYKRKIADVAVVAVDDDVVAIDDDMDLSRRPAAPPRHDECRASIVWFVILYGL